MAASKSPRFAARLRRIRSVVNRWSDRAIAAAEAIADLAEPPMEEFASSALLCEWLAEAGFKVAHPWGDMPTAFKAVRGTGRPRVAILAEYDALPNCGARQGQWGHGCGHNLLGAGSCLAGIAAAEALADTPTAGQTIVFGTPAEESLSGKVLLAEKGAFRGLDAVLAWHPADKTNATLAGGLAMDSVSFRFRGRTAHAAGSPHKGRSALDGAIITDIAVNYVREHVEDNVRMHSVIPDGGEAPNVVPERAEIWYYIRGRDRAQVDETTAWVIRCAKAGAMASETTCRTVFHDSVTERVPNATLAEMMHSVMGRCGTVAFSPSDAAAARPIKPGKQYAAELEDVQQTQGKGSSDEDNVSWFAPLARINVACVPREAVGHHREYARLVRLPGAHRGMLKAAEYLAAGAVELALNKPLLKRAQAEFRRNMRTRKYDLPKRTLAPAGGR
jgi:aminobenzoyl-glutamate utilization protein B